MCLNRGDWKHRLYRVLVDRRTSRTGYLLVLWFILSPPMCGPKKVKDCWSDRGFIDIDSNRSTRSDSIRRSESTRFDLIPSESIWFDSNRFDPIRFDAMRLDSTRFGPDGSDSSRLVWNGFDWDSDADSIPKQMRIRILILMRIRIQNQIRDGFALGIGSRSDSTRIPASRFSSDSKCLRNCWLSCASINDEINNGVLLCYRRFRIEQEWKTSDCVVISPSCGFKQNWETICVLMWSWMCDSNT